MFKRKVVFLSLTNLALVSCAHANGDVAPAPEIVGAHLESNPSSQNGPSTPDSEDLVPLKDKVLKIFIVALAELGLLFFWQAGVITWEWLFKLWASFDFIVLYCGIYSFREDTQKAIFKLFIVTVLFFQLMFIIKNCPSMAAAAHLESFLAYFTIVLASGRIALLLLDRFLA